MQDLHGYVANAMIKQIAQSIDFALLCTDLATQPFHAVPMSTKRVDDDGAVWFLSRRDSTHNANILRNVSVQLLYSDPSTMRFLNVFGHALILDDQSILRSLYQRSDDVWFNGLEDPNLTAIKVNPQAAHFWVIKGTRLDAFCGREELQQLSESRQAPQVAPI